MGLMSFIKEAGEKLFGKGEAKAAQEAAAKAPSPENVAALSQAAGDAIVDYINANGGVDGRQIELDIQDNAGDPSKAVQQLRQFVDSGYDVVLGGAFGVNCAAESAVAAQSDVIVFCISTDNLPEDDSHMFGIDTGYDVTNDIYADVLSKQVKSVARAMLKYALPNAAPDEHRRAANLLKQEAPRPASLGAPASRREPAQGPALQARAS